MHSNEHIKYEFNTPDNSENINSMMKLWCLVGLTVGWFPVRLEWDLFWFRLFFPICFLFPIAIYFLWLCWILSPIFFFSWYFLFHLDDIMFKGTDEADPGRSHSLWWPSKVDHYLYLYVYLSISSKVSEPTLLLNSTGDSLVVKLPRWLMYPNALLCAIVFYVKTNKKMVTKKKS